MGAPQLVADHHDRRGAVTFVGVGERPAEGGRHARDAKARRRHLRDRQQFGLAARNREVAVDGAERAERFHRRQLAAPGREIVERARLCGVRRHVAILDGDDALPFVERQHRPQVAVEHREDDRADGDRDGHPEAADNRQARVFAGDARSQLDVEPPGVDRSERPLVALAFLRLLDAAERAPRGVARLLGAHAFRDEALFEKLQVRLDFARQFGFGVAGAEEREQTKQETSHGQSGAAGGTTTPSAACRRGRRCGASVPPAAPARVRRAW